MSVIHLRMTSAVTERGKMSKTELIEWLEEVRAEYEKNDQLNEMWAIERVIRKVMEG